MADIIKLNDYREGTNLSHCPQCCTCMELGYAVCSWQLEWSDDHESVVGLICMNPECTFYLENPEFQSDSSIEFEPDF